jgi:hypothetical protein
MLRLPCSLNGTNKMMDVIFTIATHNKIKNKKFKQGRRNSNNLIIRTLKKKIEFKSKLF